jgi:hypothetical protein
MSSLAPLSWKYSNPDINQIMTNKLFEGIDGLGELEVANGDEFRSGEAFGLVICVTQDNA